MREHRETESLKKETEEAKAAVERDKMDSAAVKK
jgi:hypothetical protein